MDWYKYIKKYVWDDNKTPYLVPVGKLNRSQADHEVFAYVVFIAILFTVLAVVFLSGNTPYGKSYGAAFYAFSVAVGAILFGVTKDIHTAVYCGIAPLAALFFFFINGFHPNLGLIDKCVLIAFTLLWLRYSIRVVAIAKAYPDMPDTKPDG